MVRQENQKSRITAKGTPPQSSSTSSDNSQVSQNLQLSEPSPTIVPIIMFGAITLGIIVLLLNYAVEITAIGMPSTTYIFVGLGLILVGIITATQYR